MRALFRETGTSTFPQCMVDDEGRFGDPVDSTRGIFLRKDDSAYIELFDVPPQPLESADEN